MSMTKILKYNNRFFLCAIIPEVEIIKHDLQIYPENIILGELERIRFIKAKSNFDNKLYWLYCDEEEIAPSAANNVVDFIYL